MRNRIVLASIVLLNSVSLYTMERKQRFTPFSQLALELQNEVIRYVDDMSYIGQANKACYLRVKKHQIRYISTMHRLQDLKEIKLNVPPFVFWGRSTPYNPKGVYAVDPNSRVFYKDSTIEKWVLSDVRYPDTFRIDLSHFDKYQPIKSTYLLIACLQQNEREVKRLLKMYPIKPGHIIAGDPQSEKLYLDKATLELFNESLDAAKMIPGNQVMPLLLAHCAS